MRKPILAALSAWLSLAACTTAAPGPPPAATVVPTPSRPPASATPAPTQASPTFAAGACPFDVPASLKITCGFLEVREEHSAEVSRLIRLAVAIVHSSGAEPAPDPVIFLNGGPGVPTVAYTLETAAAWKPFLGERDLILFDQRGVGLSQPALQCSEVPPVELELIQQDLPPAEFDARILEAREACLRRLTADGVVLGAYNLTESAADVRDLRLALGLEQVNLFGLSYGTFLAQSVLAHYRAEGWIRSVILDSARPLWLVADAAAGTAGAQSAFEYLFRRCAEDAACHARYPDLEALYLKTAAQLAETPLTATVTHPVSGQRLKVVVNNRVFTSLIFSALYSRQAFPRLPRLIERTQAGFTDELEARGGPLQNYLFSLDYANAGLSLSLACSGRESPSTPPAEVYPDLHSQLENWRAYQQQLCADWDQTPIDLAQQGPFPSAVPALILAGEFDPVTPPGPAQLLADQWENAAYRLFPGTGHGVLTSGGKVTTCSQAITAQFLTAPGQTLDSACLADIQRPDFLIGY